MEEKYVIHGFVSISLRGETRDALASFARENGLKSREQSVKALLNFYYKNKEFVLREDDLRKEKVFERIAEVEKRMNKMEKEFNSLRNIVANELRKSCGIEVDKLVRD